MTKSQQTPIEGQEEIVLEDNQIICLLTGDIKASKPKEETLQSVIRMENSVKLTTPIRFKVTTCSGRN